MAKRRRETVNDVVYKFLAAQKDLIAPRSYKMHRRYLLPFADKYGKQPAEELTPSQLATFVTKYPDGSKHNVARSVCRAFNWAVDERLIPLSPLRGFRKHPQARREKMVTPAQYAQCLRALDRTKKIDGVWTLVREHPMRDVVKFLWHTGCRPQELIIIEASWVERSDRGAKIIFPRELSKGRKKRRVIYLDEMSENIVARLAQKHPTGPIFRNQRGTPWRSHTLSNAFRLIAKRAEIPGLCAYLFRHAQITRWLEKGIDVPTVATLAGNSPRMVLDVYQHVSQNEKRLRDLLDG